jgi:predicted RNase H-like HicB family nuclease|tara:strand:- start:548 stop:715 length:168 start_codon:yes stop_codon:yes gene_type:complete
VKPSPEETKQAIKEGLTEWLEDKFSEFGKLSLKAILALLVAGLVYFWAASQGWKI